MTHEEKEKTAGQIRIELRQVRESVGKILKDYENTAQTLDVVTEQIDGLDSTNHASNVQKLKSDLLDSLESESDSISPPWERNGYDSKQAWLEDK